MLKEKNMKALDIVIRLDDLFDQFKIDRLPSVWEDSEDVLVEIEGTNFYVQYEPSDKIYHLLEVKNHGGSYYDQVSQSWNIIASSVNLIDIFKAYLVEEIVQFSDDSPSNEADIESEQSFTL